MNCNAKSLQHPAHPRPQPNRTSPSGLHLWPSVFLQTPDYRLQTLDSRHLFGYYTPGWPAATQTPKRRQTTLVPEKKEIAVVVYTRHHRVEGTMTLLKGEHFTDHLNALEKKFESLSNARISTIDGGQIIQETQYLAVNKDEIVLMMPAENQP